MLSNLQLTTIEHFATGADDASHARRMAAKSFDRLFATGKLVQLFSRLSGKSNLLKALACHPKSTNRRTSATLDIPINQIVGSVSRSQDFDAHFNPLQIHDRERWIGVAAARCSGVILPAVELVRGEDGYYVRDGHHRISVAKAMGQGVIEARVVN